MCSTTRAYIDEETEKLMQRRARNPITGKSELIDNISYSEWIKRYDNNKLGLNSGSTSDTKKIYIGKIGKNNIDTLLQKYENSINKNNFETAFVFQKNGEVYKFIGGEKSVDIFGVNLDNAIITHNHPIDGDVYRSFGKDDFDFLKSTNAKNLTLRVTTPEFYATVKKIKDIDIGYNDIYYEAMSKCMLNESLEIQHEAMKILRDRGYVNYERRIRRIT